MKVLVRFLILKMIVFRSMMEFFSRLLPKFSVFSRKLVRDLICAPRCLIGFLIFGVEDPFFWFVIVTIGSMIPFVGTALGIIPVFILELSLGNSFAAWGILIYGLIVVSSTDNIIRLYVLKRLDNVHPLITLIGVIVGVPLFGFIGLIFGPLLISLFLVLLTIYRKEYPEEEQL